MTTPPKEEERLASCAGQGNMTIITHPPGDTVKCLVAEAGLPTSDITPEYLRSFFALESETAPLGVVGLELYGEVALLRSLLVVPQERGSGLGSALVENADRFAKDQGVRSLYLLTSTAEGFFEKLGYRRAERDAAPRSIRGTAEFSGICPVTSAFMVKGLPTGLVLPPTGP